MTSSVLSGASWMPVLLCVACLGDFAESAVIGDQQVLADLLMRRKSLNFAPLSGKSTRLAVKTSVEWEGLFNERLRELTIKFEEFSLMWQNEDYKWNMSEDSMFYFSTSNNVRSWVPRVEVLTQGDLMENLRSEIILYDGSVMLNFKPNITIACTAAGSRKFPPDHYRCLLQLVYHHTQMFTCAEAREAACLVGGGRHPRELLAGAWRVAEIEVEKEGRDHMWYGGRDFIVADIAIYLERTPAARTVFRALPATFAGVLGAGQCLLSFPAVNRLLFSAFLGLALVRLVAPQRAHILGLSQVDGLPMFNVAVVSLTLNAATFVWFVVASLGRARADSRPHALLLALVNKALDYRGLLCLPRLRDVQSEVGSTGAAYRALLRMTVDRALFLVWSLAIIVASLAS